MSSEMLYRILRSEIENRKLAVGDEMPTESELCDRHHLSRGTIRVALQRLADEGYIRAGQGRKRTVQRRQPLKLERLNVSSTNYPESAVRTRGSQARRSPSFGDYIGSLDMKPADIVLRSETSIPCYSLAEEPRFDLGGQVSEDLEIKPGIKVHWFLRLRLGDDEPVALQWAVVVASLVSEVSLDCLVPGGLTRVYEQQGIHREEVYSTYCPTRASKNEATYLRVATGAPLIEERRVSYCRSGGKERVPYEYLVSLYTERVALTFNWADTEQATIRARPKKRKTTARGTEKRSSR